MDYKYDVFISYSRKDTVIADKICDAFDKSGIKYFIDRHGIGGAFEFPAVLADSILKSKLFLYLASENSYDSKFTNSEITFAFNKKEKNCILPYIIDESNLPLTQEFIFSAINRRNMAEHPIDTVLVDDVFRMLGRERPKVLEKDEEENRLKNEIDEEPSEVVENYLPQNKKQKKLLTAIGIVVVALFVLVTVIAKKSIKGEKANNQIEGEEEQSQLSEGDSEFYKNYEWEDGTQYFKISEDKLIGVQKDIKGYLVIPQNVETIGKNAFTQNISHNGVWEYFYTMELKGIFIPPTVTNIEKGAFDDSYINTIVFDEGVTEISEYAFENAYTIKEIFLPSTLRTIGSGAFACLFKLRKMDIPNSVITIGESAFYSCKNLKSVKIPASVKKLERETFYYCVKLEDVVLCEGIRYIDYACFAECSSLKKIILPSTVRYIDKNAFRGCTNLKEIQLPSCLKGVVFEGINAKVLFY